jgi:hypothetical protein
MDWLMILVLSVGFFLASFVLFLGVVDFVNSTEAVNSNWFTPGRSSGRGKNRPRGQAF